MAQMSYRPPPLFQSVPTIYDAEVEDFSSSVSLITASASQQIKLYFISVSFNNSGILTISEGTNLLFRLGATGMDCKIINFYPMPIIFAKNADLVADANINSLSVNFGIHYELV